MPVPITSTAAPVPPGAAAADAARGMVKVQQHRQAYLERVGPVILSKLKFPAYLSWGMGCAEAGGGGGMPLDLLLVTAGDHVSPSELFSRLRWGGQVLFVCRSRQMAVDVQSRFMNRGGGGFIITQEVEALRLARWGMRLPVLSPRHYWFVATKVLLVPPGQSSDRFTYHVELVRDPAHAEGFLVKKQVPTVERVVARLREKFPEATSEELERRARKFTEKIFPLFLTREAGFLSILQKRLPEEFKCRVPHVLGMEKNERGFVQTLYMNWLRNAPPLKGGVTGGDEARSGERGGPRLAQLQFALQAGELLEAIHEVANIIHLDLRLDNIVVTRHGVGFVDFGSAVRVGEALNQSTMLTTLFDEMMRTSQIQKMLGRMQDIGQVTSAPFCDSYQKVDKAIDLFYFAMQMNSPLANSDFVGLVEYQRDSREAHEIANLTEVILRPKDPQKPTYRSAGDILQGLQQIQKRLKQGEGESTVGMSPEVSGSAHR